MNGGPNCLPTVSPRQYYATDMYDPAFRPLSSNTDRLIPERTVWDGRPRAVFPPATTLRELKAFDPTRKSTQAACRRLHAGLLVRAPLPGFDM